jgi:hypothetical protein
MENFFKSPDYIKMKTEYEKENFKLFGTYCWYDNDMLHEKTPSAMAEYFKNKKISVEIVEQHTTKKGAVVSSSRDMQKSFYQIWSEDPEMREYKEVVFNCDLQEVKDYQFNLFNGFNHFNNLKQVEAVSLDPIFEHIRTLSNYNEGHFNYILDYLAQLVQQPHILPHTCLIFITEEGVGKDVFATFLGNVLSEKYAGNVASLDSVCGKFNKALGGKLLFILNETDPVESRERLEIIKYLITADKIMIEEKYKDAVKCKNFCRFIFFSNRLFAFPVEKGARRPVIFKSSNKYLKEQIGEDESNRYFTDLIENKFKNKHYQQAFLKYLQNRDITNFNPKKFDKSELHEALEQNSFSPLVGFLAAIVKKYDNIKDVVRYTTTDTYNKCCEYMRENKYKYEMTQQKFNVELEITYKIKKIRSNGMKFEFDIKAIKAMLEKDYKYEFSNDGEFVELDSPEEIKNMTKDDYNKFYEDNLNKISTVEDDYKTKYEEIFKKYNELLNIQNVKEHVKEEVKEIEIKPIQTEDILSDSDDDTYEDEIRHVSKATAPNIIKTDNKVEYLSNHNIIIDTTGVIVESDDDSDDDIKPMQKTPIKKDVKPVEKKAKSPKKEIKPKSPKKEKKATKKETEDDNLNVVEQNYILSFFKKD